MMTYPRQICTYGSFFTHDKPELKVHASPFKIEPMVQSANNDKLRQDFSRRLNEALKVAGYAYWGGSKKLANDMKVSEKAANKWINGQSLPGPAHMRNLAQLLKVRLEWLQLESGPMSPNQAYSVGESDSQNRQEALQLFDSLSKEEQKEWLSALRVYMRGKS